jgi:CheY-like chemotaxis protein
VDPLPESPNFKILLVEDNEADVYMLRRALQNAGLRFDLTVIDNGADALRFVRTLSANQRPDIAVLDLNLPRNGGIEVLAALRATRQLVQIPVAVVTSSQSPEERTRAEALRVSKFILKPAELDGMLQIGSEIKDILLQSIEQSPP